MWRPRVAAVGARCCVTVESHRGDAVRQLDRRQLLTLLAAGTAAALAGCTRQSGPGGLLAAGPVPQPAPVPPGTGRAARLVAQEGPATSPPTTAAGTASSSPATEPVTAPPETGIAQVVVQLPHAAALAGAVALTIDDGFSPDTVAAYVEFARASGVHLTFNPNGLYAYAWEPHAAVLRPLIEAGQVQIGNHTFSHKDAKRLSKHRFEQELEKNEEWVQRAFGTTTRPWWRPPFGFHDQLTDQRAADLGWDRTLLWNGSFGDAAILTQAQLLHEAHTWLRAGTVMLGHANHPTVTHLYPQILEILTERGLTPRTLDEAFGTVRPPLDPPSAVPG